MASTSTNKQPLLIDSVLHNVVDLNDAISSTLNIVGTNTALLVVDCTTSDGAILEDVFTFARSVNEAIINLYFSSATDYLRPGEGILIGQLTSGTTVGEVTHWTDAPRVLAPMPQTGSNEHFTALYVPKGKALWACRQSDTALADGPLLGVQGGWY